MTHHATRHYCERMIKPDARLKILTVLKYVPVFPVRLGLG